MSVGGVQEWCAASRQVMGELGEGEEDPTRGAGRRQARLGGGGGALGISSINTSTHFDHKTEMKPETFTPAISNTE